VKKVQVKAAGLGEGTSPLSEQKAKALESVIKEVNSRFGSGAVMKLGDTKTFIPAVTNTGALTLDLALGGGWPKGRIVEIYGPESSGKTTVALHAMAEVQRGGGVAALIDAEHAFDAEYARKLGVDVSNLILCQPDSGEMALEVADSLVRSGAVDLIAVDSVAALAPRVEIEGEMGTVTVGAQARLMSHALRKITPIAAKSNCTILFLNQIRYKIGVLYGNPEVTSGGNALKFYASVRVEIRVKGRIEADGKHKGINVKTKVVKNKVAPPYKLAEFDIIFGEGINSVGCVLDVGETLGVVERRGSYYYLEGEKVAQGRDNTIEVLSSNATMRTQIEGSINEILRSETS